MHLCYLMYSLRGTHKLLYVQTTPPPPPPKVASDLNTAFFILFNHNEENTSSEKTSAWCFWTLWSSSAESTIFFIKYICCIYSTEKKLEKYKMSLMIFLMINNKWFYLKRCKSRAAKIIKDSNHPGNHLFILLPSGKRFRSMMAKTERLRRSFFPQAIRLLNSVS